MTETLIIRKAGENDREITNIEEIPPNWVVPIRGFGECVCFESYHHTRFLIDVIAFLHPGKEKGIDYIVLDSNKLSTQRKELKIEGKPFKLSEVNERDFNYNYYLTVLQDAGLTRGR